MLWFCKQHRTVPHTAAGFWWYITRVYRVKKKQGFGLMEEGKNRKSKREIFTRDKEFGIIKCKMLYLKEG